MAELRFDPKLGEQTAETITNILNGQLPATIMEAYELAKMIGEDNPLVEGLGNLCKLYEHEFNEQGVPRANKIRDNMMANSELAKMFNSLSVAKVAGAADMGVVKDNNYDAAKNL